MNQRDRDSWRETFEREGEATVRALLSNNRWNGQIKLEAERWLNEREIAERTTAIEIAQTAADSAVSSKRAAWASVAIASLALIVAAVAVLISAKVL